MPPDPTNLLSKAATGDEKAVSKLMPLVYDELRRLAASYLRRERPGQTLQATALVNEAYIRLISERAHNWQNRTHFLAIAALSMRQILVQRARRRNAAKRGGDPERITLDEQLLPADRGGADEVDVLALDAALERLAALDSTAGQGRRDALLRRAHDRGNRRGARHLAGNRQASLDACACLAADASSKKE